ncbi:MAG: alpha/beta hydrolase domain-containing protein [Arachnia sp.]
MHAPSPHAKAQRTIRGRFRRVITAFSVAVLAVGVIPTAIANETATPSPSATAAPTTTSPSPSPGPTGPAVVPIPKVVGPLVSTKKSHPFGAANFQGVPENLQRKGYVEEEYIINGTANVYDWPAPGPAVVRTADAPYTTRILVRKPIRGADFSGNVVVEPMNPSNLFDLNIGWAMMNRQMVANGDVWVGVTVKPVSIVALKKFDAERYGSLSMANPLSLDDPLNCAVTGTNDRATENGLAWDIMSQVGQLVRSTDVRNPVRYGAKHRTSEVYGFGYSQTGGYMYDYINGVRPLAESSPGKPIYDGYIVAVAAGAFVGNVPINQCATVPPVTDPRYQFSGVGVPIMHVMSQSDYLIGIAGRRADSDAPIDRYRQYEMAGAGHATPDELNYAARPADIIKAGQPVPPMSCNEGPRSRFPSHIFFDAILRNLDDWVRKDIAPPHGSPIVVVNGAPLTDQFGNVLGGLRSPYLDVPTSTWFGTSTGASFCFIAGHEVPFSASTLASLYSSHNDYVKKVRKDTESLVSQRFITKSDGEALIKEAKQSDIP